MSVLWLYITALLSICVTHLHPSVYVCYFCLCVPCRDGHSHYYCAWKIFIIDLQSKKNRRAEYRRSNGTVVCIELDVDSAYLSSSPLCLCLPLSLSVLSIVNCSCAYNTINLNISPRPSSGTVIGDTYHPYTHRVSRLWEKRRFGSQSICLSYVDLHSAAAL